MAEVLTQSQIDELLNSMGGGGDKPEPAAASATQQDDNWKKYDFNSPKKFTKDRLKLLKGIYDNYARLVSLRLNGLLRTMCEVEIYTVEEQRYFEFNNMLSDNDIMMIMHARAPGDNSNFPIMLHMDQQLMVSMIDRMLGGSGDEEEVDFPYEYTEIELALYKKVMKAMLEVTNNAWSNYIALIFGEEFLEDNPGLFQEVSLDEPVVIILLNIKVGGTEGTSTICIPGSLLMDIFTVIDRKKYSEGGLSESKSNNRSKIKNNFEKSQLQIRAKVSGATLSLEDVYSLKPGDVIDFNKPKDTDVTLYVEEQPWFNGKLGTFNRNAAIQISERIEGTDITE